MRTEHILDDEELGAVYAAINELYDLALYIEACEFDSHAEIRSDIQGRVEVILEDLREHF